MTINLCTVSDKVFEADGSIPEFARVRFELISWDSDQNTAGTSVVAPEIVFADVDDLTGEFSADLWQNGAGLRGTFYKVSLERYKSVNKKERLREDVELGKIQIADGTTAADMSEILNSPVLMASSVLEVKNLLDNLNFTINEQTGDYTIQENDAHGIVEMNSSSINTVTIPNSSNVNFPIGTHILVYQTGTGETLVDTEAGVTLNTSTVPYLGGAVDVCCTAETRC